MAVMAALAVPFASCSDDEVVNPDNRPIYRPIDERVDLVQNKLMHAFDSNSDTPSEMALNTLQLLDLEQLEDSKLALAVVQRDDGQYLVASVKPEYRGQTVVEPVALIPRGAPEHSRHFFMVARGRNTASQAKSGTSGDPGEPLFSVYSEYLGKGTFCFGELGNRTSSILLYDDLSTLSERYVSVNSTLNSLKSVELTEQTSESTCWQMGLDIGVDFKKTRRTVVGIDPASRLPRRDATGSISGSINFGFDYSVKESLDYEYYLNIYKVTKSEVEVNMHLFELSANMPKPDSTLFAIVNPDFLSQIELSDPGTFDPDKFFDDWGTDVITQAVFGGRCLYFYGREENCYENSVAVDAGAQIKHSKKSSQGTDWTDFYINNHSPYINGSLNFEYYSDEYQSATKSVNTYSCIGGYMTDNDVTGWLEGFNDQSKSELWALTGYRLLADEALESDIDWCLYPVEGMARNFLYIYYSRFGDTMSEDDRKVYDRVEQTVTKLADAKEAYLERHAFTNSARTPIIVADFMMLDGPDGHKSGTPTSFIAEDPRQQGKYRIYYPMMANKFSPCDYGHALDTSQNEFYAGILDATDCYWYYSLAHAGDCDGIVDIRFITEGEAGDYWVRRGDDSLPGGCTGEANYVYVKYYDPAHDRESDRITAVGLVSRPSDYATNKTVDPRRIIASSGGAELKKNCLESEEEAWCDWWRSDARYIEYTWNTGTFSTYTDLWGVCSTKPLDYTRFKGSNVWQPEPW